jgi:hypothetical protein
MDKMTSSLDKQQKNFHSPSMISFFALVISLRISLRISALNAFISNAGGSEKSLPLTC